MRRLFFGGSFNPTHHGHLICARAAAEHAGFDRVVLVPTSRSPHKPDSAELASSEHRLVMCRRAVAGSAMFEVDDLELRRSGLSYTILTVRELKRRGEKRVTWLIGADMLSILPKWHEAEQLLAEADFLVMARPGWTFDWDKLPAAFQFLRQKVVEAPQIDISATDIRRRIRQGLSIDYLTPPPVCAYIAEQGLYR